MDSFDEDSGEPEDKSWRPPVNCPRCFQDKTRFITMNHEMSVYLSEICDVEFEVEE